MKYRLTTLAAAMMLSLAAQAATESFVVSQIEFDGLSRIPAESLKRQLAIQPGYTASPETISQAIKTLYQTKQFRTIVAKRDGNTLVFEVEEQPVVSSIELEGNKMIPTEALKDGLASFGLQEGEVVDPVLLNKIEQDLERQYVSQGRYNADIVIEQKPLAQPSAEQIDIKFYEGEPANIVDVNIIGNQAISDSDIRRVLLFRENSLLTTFSKKDQYTQEKLQASLENLRSLYLDAGYADFAINHAVLNVSEDREKVYIEVGLSEGDLYQFSNVSFMGDQKFTAEDLNEQVTIESNELFSRAKLTESTQNLKRLYGNAGYYYADIRPVPQVNKENRTVSVDFFVDPGQPIYVRRISFQGNEKTDGTVLRREMRQLEGSLASNDKIQLSSVRLQRTGFFSKVNTQVVRVPGTSDQVDITYVVEEQPSGTTSLAAGYSQNGGITFQAGLTQTNFLGTGNAVSIQVANSETYNDYSLSVTDPYFTVNGVSQTLSGYFRETKSDNLNINNYLTDSIGLKATYGYPVDENTRVSAGVGVDQTTIKAGRSIAISNLDYLQQNNNLNIDFDTSAEGERSIRQFESDFLTYNLNLGWSRDTRDQPLYPTKGSLNTIAAEIAVPGSDVDYQKVTYSGNYYQPLFGSNFIARGYGKLGYGNDLPFYKNYFAGGYGSVRGYDNGSIGPRSDSAIFLPAAGQTTPRIEDPDPEFIGGNALVQLGAELIFPLPFKGDWTSKVRPSLFIEGAQVYDTENLDSRTFGDTGVPLSIASDEPRYSVGIGATWLTVIGPISLSYAKPLNEQEGDETQQVQFEVGRTF